MSSKNNKVPVEEAENKPQLSKKQFFEQMTNKFKKENPKMSATQIQAKVEGAWKNKK